MSTFKTVPIRINAIKSITGSSDITPLVDFKNNSRNKLMEHNDHDCNDGECIDATCILKKKLVSIRRILESMDAKTEYIKSGTTGHTFKISVKRGGKIYDLAMKVAAYPHNEYGDIYDIRRPENTELYVLKLLSWFVMTKQTPHIVLPIGSFNIELKKFIKMTRDDLMSVKKYRKFYKKYENDEYEPIASVLIGEWADGGDLADFLDNHYKTMNLTEWKVLFFQVISTLAVIQEVYPQFRHNDLKPNNLLVNIIEKKKGFVKYHIDGQYYIVPNSGFIIKLWDFDFACIPNLADNAKVSADWTKKINVNPEKNRYYDIHYFFNTLSSTFLPEIFTSKYVPQEVKNFIREIVPEKYAGRNDDEKKNKNVTENGRIFIKDEYVIPINIISKNNFFKEFRYSDEQLVKLYEHIKKKKKTKKSSSPEPKRKKRTKSSEPKRKKMTKSPKKRKTKRSSSEPKKKKKKKKSTLPRKAPLDESTSDSDTSIEIIEK